MRFIDALQAMARGDTEGPPVAQLLGMQLVHVEPGRTVFEMEAGPQHANPMGTLHGGILCDLADGAMGTAYASLLDDGESFTTLELKINFLKPVRTGRLEAVGTVVKAGRTVGLSECRVTDEEGSLVAHATSTCMTLRGEQAAGR